ncbi:MAG TPA: hypothetical protein VE673_17470 [Pseudonocardiaceae bacterium]|nr:hypothetical protein [Pseudonocardiaceae bacterium]
MTEDVRTPSMAQRRRSASVATSDVVRDEAVGVGQSVADAGGRLAQTAADQAKDMAVQTRQQAESLLQQGRQQLHDQAKFQQQKVALRLTTVADELRELAHSTSSDAMGEWTRQGADQLHQFASWLHDREPGELVEEVRSFARRRPGVFLLGAALAGVAVGRLTGAGMAASRQPEDNRDDRDQRDERDLRDDRPAAPVAPRPETGATQRRSEEPEYVGRYPDDDHSFSYDDRRVPR